MEWTLRGWLWYFRGAVCRRFGPNNKNLLSSLLLAAFCVVLLCIFHITVIGSKNLRASGQNGHDGEAEEETHSDYTDIDVIPLDSQGRLVDASKASPQKNKKKRGLGKKNKLKKKKKGFNPNVGFKKGSISSRADKLMFPRSDDERAKNQNQFLPQRNKPVKGPQNYQEDVITGDDIEWNLPIEQERRRALRQRSLRVRRECDNDVRGRLNRKMGIIYEHLNWVIRHDLIWCPVFKAGSTTWMKNLLLLAGENHFNGSLHQRARSLYPPPTSNLRTQNLLNKSLKFMIVRHPFDRLLSAYRDKMLRVLKTDDPYRRLQQLILEKYRGIGTEATATEAVKEEGEAGQETNPSSSSPSSPLATNIDHPTFLQFLYKVRDDMKFFWQVLDGTVVDPHWTPYWYSCAPCQIRYDIIAKVETLDEDQEFLIRAANLKGILRNARTHASKIDGYKASEAAAAEYFRQIPAELLKELEELYWPDFKLYGYTSEKYLQMAQSSS